MGLAALFTAALGAARQLAPALDDWADSHALGVGLALLLATSLSLVAAAGLTMAQGTALIKAIDGLAEIKARTGMDCPTVIT